MTENSKKVLKRLPHGADLLEELTAAARTENIRSGWLMAIGAVTAARIGYYDQGSREYTEKAIDNPMEICSCLGNISIKDNEIFVHAHITLAGKDGRVIGGHLSEGTTIFAAECCLEEVPAESLIRHYDRVTGLSLWE